MQACNLTLTVQGATPLERCRSAAILLDLPDAPRVYANQEERTRLHEFN